MDLPDFAAIKRPDRLISLSLLEEDSDTLDCLLLNANNYKNNENLNFKIQVIINELIYSVIISPFQTMETVYYQLSLQLKEHITEIFVKYNSETYYLSRKDALPDFLLPFNM